MKNFFFTLLLALFAGFSVALTACSDDSPAPTTGTVSGQITPAASVTTVTATNTATQSTTTATPTSAGAYSIGNLAPGTYTLSFTPATGFAAPATQTVTVTANTTTTATPVTTTTGGGSSGSGSFTVGGTATTPSLIVANLQLSTNLSISMASAARSVVMNIDGFRGVPGTFSLASQSSTATQLVYSETVGTSAQQWTTADFLSGGRGTGSIIITAVSGTTNPRRISGTFTATAYPAMSTTTGTRTISGSFTNVAY